MAKGDGEEQATSAGTGTADVFISYASQDAAVANAVVAALEQQGIRCWIAPRDVTPGALYAGEIVHAIDSAKAIVLILSQDAATSPHILREIERATSKRHPVVTLRLDQAPLPAEFEYFLNTSQWLDASSGEPSRAFPKLVEAVRRVLTGASAAGLANTVAAKDSPKLTPRFNGQNRVTTVVAAVLVVALISFAVDRFWLSKHTEESAQKVAATPTAIATPATPLTVAAPVFAPPPHSVAVLPFTNLSGDSKQDYFSDGMSEELINALSHIDTLEVAARTSSFSFKNQNVDIGTIARKLNVAAILEGSIRRSGNTVRISAQLIDAVNGFHMWSEDFDRNLKDVLALQTDIARAVAQQLQIKLVGDEEERIEVGGTSNPDAYVAYLHGMHLHTAKEENKGDRDRAALAAFDRAIALDANYAAAYAWRSDMLVNLLAYSPDSQFLEIRDQARIAAERSIALAPTLAVAHASLGFVRAFGYRDMVGGAAEIERAQVLAPGDARVQANVAWLEMVLGHGDQAVAAARRAVRLDALNYHRHSDLVRVLYFARRFSEALTAAQKAKALYPEGREIENYTALSYLALGKPDMARQLCESPETPLDEDERLWILSLAYRALGETRQAENELAKLMALPDKSDSAYNYAIAYAQAGNTALALQWLGKVESRHDWTSLLALRSDWMLDPIRNEPEFKAILSRMNLPP